MASFFIHPQIYPGSKKQHFQELHRLTAVPFAKMLFFDDEARNRNVEALGVMMRHVPNGVSVVDIDDAVLDWRSRS